MSNDTKQTLGTAEDLSMAAFLRTVVQQMFENDNDTTFLTANLKALDGSESTLEFKLSILSINGVKTRYEETASGNA